MPKVQACYKFVIACACLQAMTLVEFCRSLNVNHVTDAQIERRFREVQFILTFAVTAGEN